jgi:serine/threonine-protein kinase
MGCVYRASHTRLGRLVAIKVLRPMFAVDTDYVSRFFHEARIVNEARHKNIIEVVDFIEQAEPFRVAYVMELLEGEPLSLALKRHRFTVQQAINVCFQLSNALEAVHKLRVVHRDLKPDNVFVVEPLETDLGHVPSIKILDFGIARAETGDVAHRTKTGMVLGTPRYMAPEQLTGEPVSAATDIYALAEIAYELLAGAPCFRGESGALLRSKMLGTVPDLSLSGFAGAEKMLETIRACLAYEPAARPDLDAFRSALLSMLDAQRSPVPTTPALPEKQEQPALLRENGPTNAELSEAMPAPAKKRTTAIATTLGVAGLGAVLWYSSSSIVTAPVREPPKVEDYAELGKRALLDGDLEKAKTLFTSCVERNADDAICHRNLGVVYSQLKDDSMSLAHYRRYLELAPTAPDADRVRALIEQAEPAPAPSAAH